MFAALPEMIMGLLQMGISANAPYNAAKAQTYATKDMFSNLHDYQGIANATNPSATKPFYTLDAKGNTIWHSAPGGTMAGRARAASDPNYLSSYFADATRGAKTTIDNPEPNAIDKLF
jgi:hypothetical protein